MGTRAGRILSALGLAVVLTGASESRADACSCAQPPLPTEALAAAAAVFEGHVLEVSGDVQSVSRTVRFQVLRAWKGAHADSIVSVDTPGNSAACGIEAQTGTSMLVYANLVEGRLWMALCSRTHPSALDTGDFAALGPPAEVGTAAPGAPGNSGGAGGCALGGRATAPACAIVLLIALTALGARRARRRSSR